MAAETLTLVFTDIVGSTETMTRLGEMVGARARRRHFAALRGEAERCSGREVKNLGDGLMIAFRTATGALHASAAMQRATASAPDLPRGAVLPLRVGVSTGDVDTDHGDVFGRAVVEASRLCRRADGGQVLLSDSTRLIATSDPELNEIGEMTLKGLPTPTRVWELVWSLSSARPVRAVVADDAALVREGVVQLLESRGIEIVGQAGDAVELERLTAELHPDVAIIDVRMPPTYTAEGVEAAERIRSAHPRTGVLLLTMDREPSFVQRLLAAGRGGVGYLLKEDIADVDEFTAAVRCVAGGGTAFEPSLTPIPLT